MSGASSDQPPRRKRGAPPGNTNALKHGYYSPRFRPPSSTDFQRTNLPEQIDLLRAYIRRVKERSAQADDIHAQLSLLRVLALATSRLSRLLRIQRRLSDLAQGESALRGVLDETLDDCSAPPPAPEAGS